MEENQEKIEKLTAQLEWLVQRQDSIVKETSTLKEELKKLKADTVRPSEPVAIKPSSEPVSVPTPTEKPATENISVQQQIISKSAERVLPINKKPSDKGGSSINFEKFIGENLINKIGIIITVIGVSIGAKYSIDHDLISPLTRIILGYMTSIGLLAFGIRLKKNYLNFSAVLVSGAIAIMYFLTFAAYSFYGLIPQLGAFVSMLILTCFAVVASINYNKQVIAHIGLVGAYAIPFLLSDGSGNALVLLSYVCIINVGILLVSFKKYWKPVFYSAFALSWLIFCSWLVLSYIQAEHFGLSLTFLGIFFLTFYAVIGAYKLLKSEKFAVSDIILLLSNSVIFYGIGYGILSGHVFGKEFLGMFTLVNALLHFGVCLVVYRKKLADPNLFRFVAALVLTFITLAFPVQLDGNWVTLFWSLEAALLFWIGRTRNQTFYEMLALPLMVFALASLIEDWQGVFNQYYYDAAKAPLVVFNVNFLVSIIFGLCLATIYKVAKNEKYTNPIMVKNGVQNILVTAIPLLLVLFVYGLLRIEVVSYFNHLIVDAKDVLRSIGPDRLIETSMDLERFKTIWVLNYTLAFATALVFLNHKKIRDPLVGQLSLIWSVFAILFFLVQGLYEMSELREAYLNYSIVDPMSSDIHLIAIRYISVLFLVANLVVCHSYIKRNFDQKPFRIGFDLVLHVAVIWFVSSDLISWMDLAGSEQSYKLGLSILWGCYSLLLIMLGINKNKKHLRIGSLVLFAITLVKLFLYDMMDLNTIAKTIVFVSLGVLLLIISFLYNKYKDRIID